MRHQSHPTPDRLLRFLRGEVSRAEARVIVRHLLAGCRQCAAAIQPVWGIEPDRRAYREREG